MLPDNENTHFALLESVKTCIAEHVTPIAVDIDNNDQCPRAIWTTLGKAGLHGINVPNRFGGSNYGFTLHTQVMALISQASPALGLSYAAHSQLCIHHITRYGRPDQQASLLPQLVLGTHIGALAISEPSAGSDALSMDTSALEEHDHYCVNGRKIWITNAADADIFLVYAKLPKKPRGANLIVLIVPRSTPGLSIGKPLDKLGMRGSSTCELTLNNVCIPKTAALGDPKNGYNMLLSGLDYERVMLAAGPVGIMAAALDYTHNYIRQRQQFGQKIGGFQLVQAKMADMYSAYQASMAYLKQAAQACEAESITRRDAAAVILFTAERATTIALDAIQIFGGNGYMNDYPVARLLRDAKLYEIGAGTSELRRIIIGRDIFESAVL